MRCRSAEAAGASLSENPVPPCGSGALQRTVAASSASVERPQLTAPSAAPDRAPIAFEPGESMWHHRAPKVQEPVDPRKMPAARLRRPASYAGISDSETCTRAALRRHHLQRRFRPNLSRRMLRNEKSESAGNTHRGRPLRSEPQRHHNCR